MCIRDRLATRPVFKRCLSNDALLREVGEDIENLLSSQTRWEAVRRNQVLCIGTPETLSGLHSWLTQSTIPVCWANEFNGGEDKVVLANFVDAKGLERDYVFILDIDQLPDGTLTENRLFTPATALEEEARLSRIKIFISLTRALREVHVYYTQPQRRFVVELLKLKEVLEKR